MAEGTIPLHLEPLQKHGTCERRLWIGNLDSRINEYQLLKMVHAYGNIDKLDVLYHRTGPSAGQPRGFAFVTFRRRGDAERARLALHGAQLADKRLSVKFAKNTSADGEGDKPKPELGIAALAGPNSKSDLRVSKKTAIQSIEAKLKLMESTEAEDGLVINRLAAKEKPIITQYQANQNQNNTKTLSHWRRRHPYHKRR